MNGVLIVALVLAIGMCSWTRDRYTLGASFALVIGLILVLTGKR